MAEIGIVFFVSSLCLSMMCDILGRLGHGDKDLALWLTCYMKHYQWKGRQSELD